MLLTNGLFFLFDKKYCLVNFVFWTFSLVRKGEGSKPYEEKEWLKIFYWKNKIYILGKEKRDWKCSQMFYKWISN